MTENTSPDDVEDRLIEADGEVRSKFTGKPVHTIIPAALKAFAAVGVTLPEEEARSYANAVSLNAAHEFELGDQA